MMLTPLRVSQQREIGKWQDEKIFLFFPGRNQTGFSLPGLAKTVFGNWGKTKPSLIYPQRKQASRKTFLAKKVILLLVSSTSNCGSWRCLRIAKQRRNILSAFSCPVHKHFLCVVASTSYFYTSLVWLCEAEVPSWHRSASSYYGRFPV